MSAAHEGRSVPTSTERLTLQRMVNTDVEALWPILSDARMWTHHPEGRHTTLAEARRYVERAEERWSRDGLSYWTVRLAQGDEVIGAGGVQVHPRGHWNVNYRIAVLHQGHGYAGEVGAAALEAAHVVGPERPCIAWIDAGDAASRAVANRIGLVERGHREGAADDVPRGARSSPTLFETVSP